MNKIERNKLVIGNYYYDVDCTSFGDKMEYTGSKDGWICFKPCSKKHSYVSDENEDGLIHFLKDGSPFYED